MENQSLAVYGKSIGAVKAEKVVGPRGAFISFTKADGTKSTIPVGKRSQGGSLREYKVLITDGSQGPAGQAIATVNAYSTAEEMVF